MNRRFEDRLENRMERALDAVFAVIIWLAVFSFGALVASQTWLWWIKP